MIHPELVTTCTRQAWVNGSTGDLFRMDHGGRGGRGPGFM